MKQGEHDAHSPGAGSDEITSPSKADRLLKSKIGDSIDLLVQYLADNGIDGIHPLIMGEVEKRLIIRALERSRGNKVQAARMLGLSRNTFTRKLQKLAENEPTPRSSEES